MLIQSQTYLMIKYRIKKSIFYLQSSQRRTSSRVMLRASSPRNVSYTCLHPDSNPEVFKINNLYFMVETK